MGKGRELECIVIDIWAKEGNMKIVHFYKFVYNSMLTDTLEELAEYLEGNVLCCGDFNAHSTF